MGKQFPRIRQSEHALLGYKFNTSLNFLLTDTPAESHGSCNHYLGLDICFDEYKYHNYSLHLRLIEAFIVICGTTIERKKFVFSVTCSPTHLFRFPFSPKEKNQNVILLLLKYLRRKQYIPDSWLCRRKRRRNWEAENSEEEREGTPAINPDYMKLTNCHV